MGSHKNKADDTFTRLLNSMQDTPAWLATSHGERSLYTVLRRLAYSDGRNNGNISISREDLRKRLGSGTTQITRWFRGLQHYRLIEMMAPGYRGSDGVGVLAKWRLTELPHDGKPATHDYLGWDGVPFMDEEAAKRRDNLAAGKAKKKSKVHSQQKQKNRRPENGTSDGRKRDICGVQKTGHLRKSPRNCGVQKTGQF